MSNSLRKNFAIQGGGVKKISSFTLRFLCLCKRFFMRASLFDPTKNFWQAILIFKLRTRVRSFFSVINPSFHGKICLQEAESLCFRPHGGARGDSEAYTKLLHLVGGFPTVISGFESRNMPVTHIPWLVIFLRHRRPQKNGTRKCARTFFQQTKISP